jgi:ABC-type lipopolysaccharide export system ATPase subunit
MSLQAIETKREVIESRARIRELVFGIQDGLISTVGLLAGVQGATESATVVIITGLTAMFSGAISMAAVLISRRTRKRKSSTRNCARPKFSPRRNPLAAEGCSNRLAKKGSR